jgi:hypothetical protein
MDPKRVDLGHRADYHLQPCLLAKSNKFVVVLETIGPWLGFDPSPTCPQLDGVYP